MRRANLLLALFACIAKGQLLKEDDCQCYTSKEIKKLVNKQVKQKVKKQVKAQTKLFEKEISDLKALVREQNSTIAECTKNPGPNALFNGLDYTAVGSTGVYFYYTSENNYNLTEAHNFCKNLDNHGRANLGTIRNHAELKVINTLVNDTRTWVDVSCPILDLNGSPSSIRSDWQWGNNGGPVLADDEFWYSGTRPSSKFQAYAMWYKGRGLSNRPEESGKFGLICEIRD